jgi:SAM-dependent methyltransferase
MGSIVSQNYWDEVCESLVLVYKPHNIELKDIFARHLMSGGTCFEVGCYPGRYLIHLGKRFGYTVNGIDATPFVLNRMPEFIDRHNVKIGKFYHGDFLNFEPEDSYDVVLSFGFVEHFFNLEEVIEKHIRLVKPAGTLILACPNFRGLQYVFRRLLEPSALERHVLDTMNLFRWKTILDRNNMDTLEHGYYRTADFWVDTPREGILAQWAIKYLERVTKGIDKRVNWPNRLLSPFMFNVSRKG